LPVGSPPKGEWRVPILPYHHRMRPRSLVPILCLIAACSSAPVGGSSTTSPAVTTTTVAPDPWDLPDDGIGVPTAPLGSGPSFTESAGCAAPQGIRGPYASLAGYLDDPIAIGGPWGSFFGRDLGEVRAHLVPMDLPNGDDPPVTVYVHERVAPALQTVIDTLVHEQELGNVYHLDPSQVSSFWPATIPPKRYMSFHAMGMAIDINSRINEYREDNVLVTDLPDWFVKAWTDAGWCWGGQWQDIKDAMHFSWKGPNYTAGYPAIDPMPVRTEAAGFDRSFRFGTGLGALPAGGRALIGDIDRDGAPDVVHVVPQSGGAGLLAAVAIHGYLSCSVLGPTDRPVPSEATALLVDVDGDSRPDLVLVGPDGGTVSLVSFTHATGFTRHLPVIHTAIPATDGAAYLMADLDRDGVTDLWQVAPGALVTVWAGPDFARRLVAVHAPVDASWRFALGDRDGDGVVDLLALGPGELVVLDGASGLAGEEHLATTDGGRPGTLQAADFDGDGRADLFLLGADGEVSVLLGGDRSGVPDEGLMSWFLQGGDQPWEAWDGCPYAVPGPR
jgi:hypothetical protein